MGQNGAKTVLVVEDDPANSEMMALVLDAEGFHVVVAQNGSEALELMERQMPDLVVLDLRMPVMDGWEFARQCRARHGGGVPIIVCTAFASQVVARDEIQAEVWLEKPFDIDELLAAARRACTASPA